VLSESVEMYLLKVALLQTDAQPVPIATLAESLGVTPVSVNQMCRKLEERELVTYEPYKGVTLTGSGRDLALSVLRKRRLWEVFLSDRLGVDPVRAEEIACRFEHVTPDSLAERLAVLLGHPSLSPQSEPIPPSADDTVLAAPRPLSSLGAGERGVVSNVATDDAARDFVRSTGVRPGADVSVLAVSDDGAMLLDVGGHRVSLAGDLAAAVDVAGGAESLPPLVSLDRVPIGKSAKVVRVGGERRLKRRLMDMGVVRGETIRVNKVAPLGDPIEIRVMGYQLSLRKSEARHVLVAVEPE
jgi:DtxR family Mn-dependent transcriptional regulator